MINRTPLHLSESLPIIGSHQSTASNRSASRPQAAGSLVQGRVGTATLRFAGQNYRRVRKAAATVLSASESSSRAIAAVCRTSTRRAANNRVTHGNHLHGPRVKLKNFHCRQQGAAGEILRPVQPATQEGYEGPTKLAGQYFNLGRVGKSARDAWQQGGKWRIEGLRYCPEWNQFSTGPVPRNGMIGKAGTRSTTCRLPIGSLLRPLLQPHKVPVLLLEGESEKPPPGRRALDEAPTVVRLATLWEEARLYLIAAGPEAHQATIGGASALALHLHCYDRGTTGGLGLRHVARRRLAEFWSDLPSMLNVVRCADGELWEQRRDVDKATVWVSYHSSIPEWSLLQCLGQLDCAATVAESLTLDPNLTLHSDSQTPELSSDWSAALSQSALCAVPPPSSVEPPSNGPFNRQVGQNAFRCTRRDMAKGGFGSLVMGLGLRKLRRHNENR